MNKEIKETASIFVILFEVYHTYKKHKNVKYLEVVKSRYMFLFIWKLQRNCEI